MKGRGKYGGSKGDAWRNYVPPVIVGGTRDLPAPPAAADLAALGVDPAKRRKYINEPVVHDGHRFDSKKEGARYLELRNAQRGGAIVALTIHPTYPLFALSPEGVRVEIGRFTPDFQYADPDGTVHIEDTKSPLTREERAYRLRKRIFEVQTGWTVEER